MLKNSKAADKDDKIASQESKRDADIEEKQKELNSKKMEGLNQIKD